MRSTITFTPNAIITSLSPNPSKGLELRGAGKVLGTRQTGEQGLRIANIGRDAYLLPTVQSAALWLRTEQPTTVEALIQRWRQHTIDYGNI